MSSSIHDATVMMVGVVPPPVHGQSIATQALFDADLSPVKKILIPIRSSKTLESVGKFTFSKVSGLILLVLKAWAAWLRHRPSVLYYTAGSGAWIPFIRDFVFLTLCRPLFRRTLIHYHSGNLVEFLEASRFRSIMGRFIYGRDAWTIRLGEHCPAPIYPGGRVLDVPNGIDAPTDLLHEPSASFRILFLGNLFKDKGVIDLIDAVSVLAEKHPLPITLSLIGGWPDGEIRKEIESRIAALPANVTCPPPAPAYGPAKWHATSSHDVFAFPSYYRSENFPLVIIEAMAAGLPVIASDWRGIPSLVKDRETGLLVPPRDIHRLASALENLLLDPALRTRLAEQATAFYQEHLTAAAFTGRVRAIMIRASSPDCK
ncbi:glycosyltransferase family 4 protein [Luteolibacter sp. SL250]|uniref:glycosyltransferase family 4 protein n=1 Tax=Luteolibacter sp. SL250 TaxID=2995170 RepID=UPI00226D7820|nr:glycosyltransferase family 4 protein [Luteolibacter sp. SL250]WAC20452.1 glycosyltransferase family 4 protein [Luteolibacter sp. SL250]